MLDDPSFVDGQLLRIFIGEDARWHGEPLYVAIVETLRRENVAGASVFRGVEGFGTHHEIHLDRMFTFGALRAMADVNDDLGRSSYVSRDRLRWVNPNRICFRDAVPSERGMRRAVGIRMRAYALSRFDRPA